MVQTWFLEPVSIQALLVEKRVGARGGRERGGRERERSGKAVAIGQHDTYSEWGGGTVGGEGKWKDCSSIRAKGRY